MNHCDKLTRNERQVNFCRVTRVCCIQLYIFCFIWGEVVSSTTFWFIDLKPSRGDGVALRLFALFFDVISQLHIGCIQRQIGVSFNYNFYHKRVSYVKHERFFTGYILAPERIYRKFCALYQVFTTKAKTIFSICIVYCITFPYLIISGNKKYLNKLFL